jgi:hypothetical protein
MAATVKQTHDLKNGVLCQNGVSVETQVFWGVVKLACEGVLKNWD